MERDKRKRYPAVHDAEWLSECSRKVIEQRIEGLITSRELESKLLMLAYQHHNYMHRLALVAKHAS